MFVNSPHISFTFFGTFLSSNQLKGKKGLTTNGFAAKQKLDKNQPKKANGISSTVPVKRNNSSKRL